MAVSGNVVSNSLTLPVAPSGGMCTDPTFGTTGALMQTLSGRPSVNTGFVGLLRTTSGGQSGTTQTKDTIQATFSSLAGSAYSAGSSAISLGSCFTRQSTTASTPASTGSLDAGLVTINGPAGLAAVSNSDGAYLAQLASGFIPTAGGSFTVQGSGGHDVGNFAVTLSLPSPSLTWSNVAANSSIDRSQGATITWSGGAPNSYVAITGTVSPSADGQPLSASYTCVAPVAASQFTVPPAVLLSMPPGAGTITVANSSNFQTFTASGLDFGFAFAGVSQQINVTYN